MPYCQYCGRQIAEGVEFCTNCGRSVAQAPSPPLLENLCSNCSGPLRFIDQHRQWWCDNCRKYIAPKQPPTYPEFQMHHIIEAAKSQDVQKVRTIIERKPILTTAKDKEGMTAVHFCAALNQTEIVGFLLSKGADINVRNSTGWTPLHFAALQGHSEMTKFLLANGADSAIHGNSGDTPLDIATQRGMKLVQDILRSHDSKSKTAGGYSADDLLKQGMEHCQHQAWKEAIEVCTRAVQIKPDLAKAHQILFVAYGGLLDRDNAMKHYEILKGLDAQLTKELEETAGFTMIQRLGSVVSLEPPTGLLIQVHKKEEVKGIIKAQIRGEKGASLNKALFFTSTRLIVAETETYAYMFTKKPEKLRKLSPPNVLRENISNFAIPYSDITKVNMKKGRAFSPCTIEISTGTEKLEYEIMSGFMYREFEDQVNFVRSIFPDRFNVS